MEIFTPTLDWGNDLWPSVVWIARAWVIAAIVADRVFAALVAGLAIVVGIGIKGGVIGDVLTKIEKRVGDGRLVYRLNRAGIQA